MEEFELELKKSTINELEDTLDELIDILQVTDLEYIDLDAVFRAAHSLKGNSKAADFHSIASVTHKFEDLLLQKQNEKGPISEKFYNLLLSFTDEIQYSLDGLKQDINTEADFNQLEEIIITFEENVKQENKVKKSIVKYKKLLLIDDDIDIYNIINKYLSEQFEIDYVTNAVQAIEDCKSEAYDLIICDYKMPIMNGQEFALYLRQGSTKNKQTSMIFLTAFSPELFNQKSIWENVLFMDKPIDKNKLKYYARCAIQETITLQKIS